MYHGINGIRNGDDLVVKDLHHSFKGSKVTCTVTDIIGIKSGFSNAISVDPYCKYKQYFFMNISRDMKKYICDLDIT